MYTYRFFISDAGDVDGVRNALGSNNIQYYIYTTLTRTCASRRAEDEPSGGVVWRRRMQQKDFMRVYFTIQQ